MHAVLKLRPLLTFLHLYLALVSIISAGAAFMLKADPLTTFQNQDHETYIFTQGIMGVVFVFYCFLLVVAFLRSHNNTEWLIRVVQLAGALTIASLYYQLFWEPAMLEKVGKQPGFSMRFITIHLTHNDDLPPCSTP